MSVLEPWHQAAAGRKYAQWEWDEWRSQRGSGAQGAEYAPWACFAEPDPIAPTDPQTEDQGGANAAASPQPPTDQPAAAAGALDQPCRLQGLFNAVVFQLPPPGLQPVPAPPEVKYTLDQIRAFDTPTQRNDLNNVALKWLRDTNENPPGVPTVEYVDITDQPMIDIGMIVRSKGPLYAFDPIQRQPWSWLAMIKGYRAEVQARIVGNGLVSIRCMPIPDTYDHKRCKAMEDAKTPYRLPNVQVWDFVVEQSNGTQVRFHPNLKGGKVTISSMAQQPEATHPDNGLGKSDGRGTFRSMVRRAYPGGEAL